MDYNRTRLHFDRSRLLLGTYCLAPYAQTEAHIKAIADAGIDFICAAPYDNALLDLCEKYGVGIFATGILPGWWGGDGDRAGNMAQAVPVSSYEAAAAKFADHPAAWGVDTGDEPSALEFSHYGRLFESAYRLFQNQMPYLNLYPNYASVCENTDSQKVSQLGTRTYSEYIDRYAENIDCDYLCYDYYMYAAGVSGAFENLRITADKCRATGRDLWIVLQVNSNVPDKWISENMLRYQAYTAMAFGVRSINWACWTAGWWHHEVLDDTGAQTEQYAKLCRVNPELKASGESYMKYDCRSTHFIGFNGSNLLDRVGQAAENNVDLGRFRGVSCDGCAVAGHFTGSGLSEAQSEALMIADAADPYDTHAPAHTLTFKADGKITALVNGAPVELACADGVYCVELRDSRGVFITVE